MTLSYTSLYALDKALYSQLYSTLESHLIDNSFHTHYDGNNFLT